MGKKFEGGHPEPLNIIDGMQVLGLSNLIGKPGKYTAVEFESDMFADELQVYCLPGSFSAGEVERLLKDAGLLAA